MPSKCAHKKPLFVKCSYTTQRTDSALNFSFNCVWTFLDVPVHDAYLQQTCTQ